jgi:hypothetical protein
MDQKQLEKRNRQETEEEMMLVKDTMNHILIDSQVLLCWYA